MTRDTTSSGTSFLVTIMSYGYKNGQPPDADILFDVRFLQNPYWVEELRHLSGIDEAVQQYVLEQDLAQVFLNSLLDMLGKILPRLADGKVDKYTIALGCTGGQHRSVALVEASAAGLSKIFPQYKIIRSHRDLENHSDASANKKDDRDHCDIEVSAPKGLPNK